MQAGKQCLDSENFDTVITFLLFIILNSCHISSYIFRIDQLLRLVTKTSKNSMTPEAVEGKKIGGASIYSTVKKCWWCYKSVLLVSCQRLLVL